MACSQLITEMKLICCVLTSAFFIANIFFDIFMANFNCTTVQYLIGAIPERAKERGLDVFRYSQRDVKVLLRGIIVWQFYLEFCVGASLVLLLGRRYGLCT